jgi:hypothetical protein
MLAPRAGIGACRDVSGALRTGNHEIASAAADRAAITQIDPQAAAEADARRRRRRPAILAALFATSFLVFILAPVVQVSDSKYTLLVSESLLEWHTPLLDHYQLPRPRPDQPRDPVPLDEANSYQLSLAGGHIIYFFPHGSSYLSLPFVAVMNWLGVSAAYPDGRWNLRGEVALQMSLAALLMATLTCIFFATAALLLPDLWSAVVALGAAFGTQVLSAASRGLWSHTWEILLLAAVIYLLLAAERGRARMRPVVLATLLAWAYFARPTAAPAIVAISVYMLVRYRRQFLTYAIAGAFWFAAFVAYSWGLTGHLLPDYYVGRLDFSNYTTALLGHLISPSRGFFVYVPESLFVLYLVARYFRHLPSRGLAIVALATATLDVVLIAGHSPWFGGWCYGARILTDIVPWFVLLAILALSAMRASAPDGPPRLAIGIGGALLLVGIAINARGAYSQATMDWNLGRHGEDATRIFDWSYPQFLAGLINPPQR